MSYILEALKKAQAERQLGSSPTLHAPTLQGEQASPAARFSLPLIAAVIGMAAVIGVLAVLVWRPSEPAAPAAVPGPSAAPSAPALAPPVSAPPAVAQAAPTPLPAPVADLPPSVANLARAAAPASSASAAAAPAAPAAKPAAAAEEPVVNLRELPEPIQRSIPPVSVGGYIYSKNAADRLLLVDKVLRREGEEVAPGLILEKLQPKEAVFNFKGYRYRVPY
jgi:general secretion pathway protein B